MKESLLLFFIVLGVYTVQAQEEREEPPLGNAPAIRIQEQRLLGKVMDGKTRQGMAGATVQLFALRNPNPDSLISTQVTRGNGDFSFTQLPLADSFRVTISGIGFATWTQTIAAASFRNGTTDLGNIALEQQVTTLSNVVVTAQRPALQMGIDRKIFSVEQSLTTTGGTALDVMRNIPSVSVDVEGNVQLRNAEPQIFIDGRPTILTPDQIPADQIERIELITNPSARFDAASSGGIINIVMKRNRRVGLNGVATAGAGYPTLYNGNLTLNARQGKWNVFASGSYNQQSSGKAKSRTLRQNKEAGVVTDYFNQYALNDGQRRFQSVRFGVDFFATNRTTLSITQNLSGGTFRNDETQDQEYLNSNRELERLGYRRSESRNQFNRNSTQLNFTQKFAQPGKELSASINYNYGKGNDGTAITNRFFFPNGVPFSAPAQVRNAGRNNSDQYTLQVDYVVPSGEDARFEAGFRSNLNEQESFFSSYSVANGAETRLPLSNDYTYLELVNAVYASWSDKLKFFSYQAGLRAEVSSFEGQLLGTDKTFGYDYPNSAKRFFDALFPSLFLTKAIGDDVELQVNYTRRIRRPNFWQLNPFIDINDPVNLRQGNPELQPEFINSFEFNYSRDYTKGNFLGVVYYRNNLRDITRYSDTISTALYQQLNNAAIDPNAILNTFINAKSTNSLGLELTLQHQLTPQFGITPTIDMQHQKVNADVAALRLSNSGFNWDAELTMNYKFAREKGLLKNLGLQLVGEYGSESVTPQGRNLAEYQVDFGLRKEFLKDKKGAFSFNINDLFDTQRFGSILDTERLYQESYRRRNVRSFRVNFTYKFGKDNFNLSRREEREREED